VSPEAASAVNPAVVRGYDPAVFPPAGIADTGSEAEAAAGAGLVLSVNSSKAAAQMLTDLGVAPLMADASRAVHERLAAEEER
jgi:hypothetical protein